MLLHLGRSYSSAILVFCAGAFLGDLVAAPSVSTPEISHIGANQVTLKLRSSAAGRGYFTLLVGNAVETGNGAQTAAGQDGDGEPALRMGSLALAADTPGLYTVRNLEAETTYTACFTAEDGEGVQPSPSSLTFTTARATSLINARWVPVGGRRLSQRTADSPSLAVAADGVPYVAYADAGLGFRVTAMRFLDGVWAPLGAPGFSAAQAFHPMLVLAPDGTPHVSFCDSGNDYKATVMKFDGASWVALGGAGFSAAVAVTPALAFGVDGRPYVVFQDGSQGPATVMRFDGSVWETVGKTGFSEGEASTPRLVIAADGTPYVVYRDGTLADKLTVQRFTAEGWTVVGSPGFTDGMSIAPFAAFDTEGRLWVVYQDVPKNYDLTAMRFDGSEWSTVGARGFSGGSAMVPVLAFASDGSPYVAFRGQSKATVMRYDGAGWSNVGDSTFWDGVNFSMGLDFAPTGEPYIAFHESASADFPVTVARLEGPPKIIHISRPDARTYGVGDVIGFTVQFSRKVTVSGAPRLTLFLADSTVHATYRAGSGTSALTFTYTVRAGDVAPLGIELDPAIELNGGAVTGESDSPAELALTPVGDLTGIVVETAAPVLSLPTATSTEANQVTLAFSCDVAGVGYFTLLKGDALPGTAAQTRLGQGPDGSPAYRSGSVRLVANTPASYTVQNLTHDTTYTVCFTAEHSQEVVTSRFSTAAFPTPANTGWVALGSISQGRIFDLSLVFSRDGTPHIAYRASADEFLVMKYVGGEWIPVGDPAIPIGTGSGARLAFAPNGEMYVAYADAQQGRRPTVRRFCSGEWTTVGQPGFTTGAASPRAICFAPDGAPHVVFTETSTQSSSAATVMRFANGEWSPVGPPGLTGFIHVGAVTLAIAPDGSPHVAYVTPGGYGTVLRWSGSAWEALGQSLSAGNDCPRLAFSPDGEAYIAFKALGLVADVHVLKFQSGVWESVGTPTIVADVMAAPDLAFGPDGAPYVLFSEPFPDSRGSLLRFDGDRWDAVGLRSFTPEGAYSPSLVFAPGGAAYVLSTDANDRATLLKQVPTSRITRVRTPPAGVYLIRDELRFTVEFDRPVIVSAPGPSLELTLADGARRAAYRSGSGGNALVFAYVPDPGDSADAITLAAELTLDGATIVDSVSGAPALLALANIGDLTGIRVAAAPVIDCSPPYEFSTLAGDVLNRGGIDGVMGAAQFSDPTGVAVDREGNVYVADTANSTIRKITAAGVVTTLAGAPGWHGSSDGVGSEARFNRPRGIAAAADGRLYVADTGNFAIRLIENGRVTTLAGAPGFWGSADGTGAAARFTGCEGIAVDSSDNVYVVDRGNRTVRKISPNGVVSTLAGLSGHPGSSDGQGTAGRFWDPRYIAVDTAGCLYVTDPPTIRKISPDGTVTTIAGAAERFATADGGSADARFRMVTGIAVDADGTLYVVDSNTIRKIAADGDVTTVAGAAGQPPGSSDGVGPEVRFHWPGGLAVDAEGALYVADTSNHTIRKAVPIAPVPTLTSVTRISAASLSPGDVVRFQLNFTAGDGGVDWIEMEFRDASGARRTALVMSPSSGVTIAVDVASNWLNGAYQLTQISISDSDNTRTTSYKRDGIVVTTPAQPGAPNTHAIDFATEDFRLTGGFGVDIVITTGPFDQTATAGTEVSFTVEAEGTDPLAYEWRKNGTTIAGASNAKLSLSEAQLTDAGDYLVVVSNSTGSKTSRSATLTVTPALVAPAIATEPLGRTVAVGANTTFSVTATGSAPLGYQWRKGGADIPGATSATYVITSAQLADAGNYSVEISNRAGSVTSDDAILTVQPIIVAAPSITAHPDSAEVYDGNAVQLAVTASGSSPLSYQWFRGSSGDTSQPANCTDSEFVTPSIIASTSFWVRVSNSAGAADSNTAVITVKPTVFTTQPDTAVGAVGGTASFSFAVRCSGAFANLGILAFKDGADASSRFSVTSQTTGNVISSAGNFTTGEYTVEISELSLADSGDYRFEITVNGSRYADTTSRPAHLTIETAQAPTITASPTSVTIAAGHTASFSVAATGLPPPTYRWQESADGGTNWVNLADASNVSGAATATLSVNALSTARTGFRYRCIAINSAGHAESAAAILTVSRVAQTIAFAALADKTYGDEAFALNATASSELPVSFSVVSGPATITGDLVTVTGAGTVTIRAAQAGNATFGRATDVERTFVVTKASLTATADSKSKRQGAANPPLTITYSGFVNRDTTAVLTTEPAASTPVTAANAEGTYPITLMGGSALNYDLILIDGIMTVMPIGTPVFVTQPLDVSLVEGGAFTAVVVVNTTNLAPVTWLATLASGRTIMPSASATSQSNDRIQATLTFGPIIAADAGVFHVFASNEYGIARSDAKALTVVMKPVLEWSEPIPVTYGAALSSLQLNATADVTGTFAYTPTAGTILAAGSHTLSVTFTPSNTATHTNVTASVGLVVDKAPLNIAADARTRPYGTANPELTVSYSGFVNDETVAVLTTLPTVSTTAAIESAVGMYEIEASGGTAANYAINYTNGTLTVAKAPLTVKAADQTRVYGAVNPELTVNYSGFVNGETAAVLTSQPTISTNATITSAPGSYPITLTGGRAVNYALTLVDGALLVTPANYAGTYFGTINGGGRWALKVNTDNTGVFIAYLADRRSAVVLHLTVDESGRFSVASTENVPQSTRGNMRAFASGTETDRSRPAAAPSAFTLSGRIGMDGALSGQIDGLGETFSGAIDAEAGSTTSGYYTASALNTDSGATYVIVAPSGQALIVVTTSTTIEAVAGTVNSSGKLTAVTDGGAQVVVTLHSTGDSVTATLTPSGSTASVHFSGLADTVEPAKRLVNISTRAYGSTGNNVTIGGFVIAGAAPKRLLLRVVGPTLTTQGIGAGSVMLDPTIDVFDAHRGNAVIASIDNWADNTNPTEITTVGAQLGAAALAGSDANSAAVILTLDPGVYTFVARGKAETSGIVLVEAYDADAATAGSTFSNISTRAYCMTGDRVSIGGFVVSGNAPKRVLLRAVGPTLATQGLGVAEVLADPMISVHDARNGNAVIASNDNWSDNAMPNEIVTNGARLGATPFAASDTTSSALLLTLQPGIYTFIASGKDGTSGIVLVEVYDAD